MTPSNSAGTKEPNRTPRKEIRQKLRQEVGFGCPIPGCGVPYLTWHHFDPPWRILKHENPSGIIPLCRIHHDMADAGTWTKGQLHTFKRSARQERGHVKGRFQWMNQQLLGVLGGNFAYECPTLLYCCKQPVIWFNRNHDGFLLVNLAMPRTEVEVVPILENNDWVVSTEVEDIESPPNGRILSVKYPNGDKLKIEFKPIETNQEAVKRYPDGTRYLAQLEYPLVGVEFEMKVAALDIDIGPTQMRLPNATTVRNSMAIQRAIGFAVGEVIHDSGGGVGLHIG
jgi:hypothetical protein